MTEAPASISKDCQVRFKMAWTRIRAGLTEESISIAARHAANLAAQKPSSAGEEPQPENIRNPENNRAAPRQRVFKAGTIEFGGGGIDCIVRNFSETGAALEVTTPLSIPDRFTLFVSSDQFKRACHIVWRKEKRIGIAFD
jgi:hypothetical protein